jgi:N-methylhydantoinase B
MGGGMGGGPENDGLSAIQTHMTNTLNTPIEVLESHYPLRIRRYEIRDNSGGMGEHHGGDGLVREFEFLAPTSVTLLTERRYHAPWGLQGGGEGQPGRNWYKDKLLPPKISVQVKAGDRITVETPGGGAWGRRIDPGPN